MMLGQTTKTYTPSSARPVHREPAGGKQARQEARTYSEYVLTLSFPTGTLRTAATAVTLRAAQSPGRFA